VIEPITIRVEGPGIYSVENLPSETEFDEQLFLTGDPGLLRRDGDVITVTARNATATYRITGAGQGLTSTLLAKLESAKW
jgi:hypothetical protein